MYVLCTYIARPFVSHPPSLARRRSCWLYAAVVPGTNCCSSNVPGTTFCCCNLPGTFFCVSCVYVRYKNSGGRATAGERAGDGGRATTAAKGCPNDGGGGEQATAGERRRASDSGRASKRAIGRRRALDDSGPSTPGRWWRRAIDGAIDRASELRRARVGAGQCNSSTPVQQ